MQLFVLILNKLERLEPLLEHMLMRGIGGATILDSQGMMRALSTDINDLPMFGMLRHFVDPKRESSKTIMVLIDDDRVDEMFALVDEETGGLDNPDTGVAFLIPTSRVKGVVNKR